MVFRLAVVGFGAIARNRHLPAITATPGVELVGVASHGETPAGVPGFPSLRQLLASGLAVDAVALCTPPQGRAALAAEALAAGKHVLLEKPPGATLSEWPPLADLARDKGLSLFGTWHSRFAPAVEATRAALRDTPPRAVRVEWKEDVRHWHPGQAWIWEPGGMGVFDPGINALSILTRILPAPISLRAAELSYPANREAPIAARLSFADLAGTPVEAEFDWRQTGRQSWDIHLDTTGGTLLLEEGGRRLLRDGTILMEGPDAEYEGIYAHFVDLVAQGRSDLDLTPMMQVADAFMLGRRHVVAPFNEG
ncbi:Gfo/Idh/MocA family protein [Roseomonas sp. WA12]